MQAVRMYTTAVCPYCIRAKQILKAKGLGDSLVDFQPRLCGAAIDQLGPNGPALCEAYGEGLRSSMIATTAFFVVAAVFYFLASRTFIKDRWSPATA